MNPLLSIAILARDEERYIGGCLESIAGVADEVVVLLDTRSRDRTELFCQTYGARVHREPWRGFPAQRNRALHLCRGTWVFFLDADERLTPELRHELAGLRHELHQQAQDGTVAGYLVPRYNIFFGQVLRGGGWYPDTQLRLLQRTRAHYNESQTVHEVATLNGDTRSLASHLLHINIEYLGEFWHKQTCYALEEARTLSYEQRRARWRNFAGAPAREFWQRYILLHGWRDGPLGLFLCLSLAWFEVVKFGCLRLLQHEHPTQKRSL